MKYKYFVIGDNGQDQEVDKKTFIYYIKEFARSTFDKNGNITSKTNYSDIENAYNPQGVLIAWRNQYDNSFVYTRGMA